MLTLLHKHVRQATNLVGLGLELLFSHAIGPEVPENAANRVGQHDLDLGVHVLQEAAGATDGATSTATSNKMGHTRFGLHPDLRAPIQLADECGQASNETLSHKVQRHPRPGLLVGEVQRCSTAMHSCKFVTSRCMTRCS